MKILTTAERIGLMAYAAMKSVDGLQPSIKEGVITFRLALKIVEGARSGTPVPNDELIRFIEAEMAKEGIS